MYSPPGWPQSNLEDSVVQPMRRELEVRPHRLAWRLAKDTAPAGIVLQVRSFTILLTGGVPWPTQASILGASAANERMNGGAVNAGSDQRAILIVLADLAGGGRRRPTP